MIVDDTSRLERKLSQVGYYRLSGYWYPCREIDRHPDRKPKISPLTNKPERKESFSSGVTFDKVFELYLFDKKLRQLMLDAIERVEVHVRSIIAHELGSYDPLAYQKSDFINPSQTCDFWDRRRRRYRNIWSEWSTRQHDKVTRSQEDCIVWHKMNEKPMPFWVVVEAWDFGTMSKYFEILKGQYQNQVCARLGIDNAYALKHWLQEINTLRNRCAHHTRIWNQQATNALPVTSDDYFARIDLSPMSLKRLYGLIAVLWFLVRRIGVNSEWIHHVGDVVDSKPDLPGCPYSAMGLPLEDEFPVHLFL